MTPTDLPENLAAIALNPTDYFLYAIAENSKTLYRIENDGKAYLVGEISKLPSNSYISGTFDNLGNYYLKTLEGEFIFKIDLAEAQPKVIKKITLDKRFRSHAMAFNPLDSKIYTIADDGKMIVIKTLNGKVRKSGDNLSGNWTALFANALGEVYAFHDTGGLFQFDPITGNSHLISDRPESLINGAVSCQLATPPFTVIGDVAIHIDNGTETVTAGNSTVYTLTARNLGSTDLGKCKD